MLPNCVIDNLNGMNKIGCSTIIDDWNYVIGHSQIYPELEELNFCAYLI